MAGEGSKLAVTYSSYFQTLDVAAKARYNEKLAILGGIQDPYVTVNVIRSEEHIDWLNWPNIEYPDIYNYFVTTPSSYTKQQLKAYKSLDGYKYFVDGWVSDVIVWSGPRPRVKVVCGKVKHSQKLSASVLQPWVALEKEGLVICAHCNCMAGLGEACSHVAALLFLLEANSQLKKNLACTSQPCYWLPPTFKNVQFSQICDIDFTSAVQKRRKICGATDSSNSVVLPSSTPSSVSLVSHSDMPTTSMKPSSSELEKFYRTLSNAGKPVVLSLVPGYCEAYVPLQSKGVLPPPLSDLYKEEYLALSYPEILTKSEEVFKSLSITSEQVKAVEQNTREQSNSKTWFRQRAARITASRFKAAVRTDLTQPSQSLIKIICYPENHCFKTKATQWGCTHEQDALKAYKLQEESHHRGFKLSSSGFLISTEYPHMGASPDGLVNCDCCERRVIEVKCPYSCTNKSFLEATAESTFFLQETDGKFSLKHNHAYYYQIQLQMKFCGTTVGDFIVWRENELVIDRVPINDEFLTTALQKATKLYIYGILPEVLGKWYTRLPDYTKSCTNMSKSNVHGSDSEQSGLDEVWCFCRCEESGEMIGCDDEQCNIKWFHMDCLRIDKVPKGKWFCPECSKRKRSRLGKRKATIKKL